MDFNELLLQIEEDLNELTEVEEKQEEDELLNTNNDNTDIIKQSYLSTINKQCIYDDFTPTNPRISIITICASINTKCLDNDSKDFINKEFLNEYCCPKCMGIYETIENHHCEVIKRK